MDLEVVGIIGMFFGADLRIYGMCNWGVRVRIIMVL